MITKKGLIMQSVQIAKTRSQPVRPVVAFRWKVECKKYPKAVWNSMTGEQQMQVHKLHEQQGIKSAMKQTSTDARISALEAKLEITFQPKECDVKGKGGQDSKEPNWGKNWENPAVTHWALGAKCKEPGWFLGSSNGDISHSCADKDVKSVICANV